jgi:hypothetical protein
MALILMNIKLAENNTRNSNIVWYYSENTINYFYFDINKYCSKNNIFNHIK